MKEKIFKILHNRDRMPGERFGDIEGKIENLVNQEVEKRIAERVPTKEWIASEARKRFTTNTGFFQSEKYQGFIRCGDWLRSRLTPQVTPQDTPQVQKEGGGE